jgi:ATP-dependent DNA helicase RecG
LQYSQSLYLIIIECPGSGLPEPWLEEDQGGIRVTFRKNIYTEADLTSLGLNERQIKAVLITKDKGYITNKQYQKEFEVTDRTALRDLNELVRRKLLYSSGTTRDRRSHLKN